MFVEKETTVLLYNWVSVFDPFSFFGGVLFSSFFPSKLRPPCKLFNVRSVGAGLSHDVSLGVSAGLSFLPATVGWVRGSSRSVQAKVESGAEITMTRHKA